MKVFALGYARVVVGAPRTCFTCASVMSYFTFSKAWPFGMGFVLAACAGSLAVLAGAAGAAVVLDVLDALVDVDRFAHPSSAASAIGTTSSWTGLVRNKASSFSRGAGPSLARALRFVYSFAHELRIDRD